jgi:hypothetical protein
VLYRADAFEPLTDAAWDEARVRRSIAAIVADADAAFGADALWPADEWDAWTSPLPLKNLYVGGAGVIWALDALRRRGYAESTLDLAAAARRALEAWREQPDFARGIELPAGPRGAGAPGIVASAAQYLDQELLLAGAELAWRAGPPAMAKGACICHGTSGNATRS